MKTLTEHLKEVTEMLLDETKYITLKTNEKGIITYPIANIGRVYITENFHLMMETSEQLCDCKLSNIIPVTDIKYGQVIGIEKLTGIPYFLIIDANKTTYITPVFQKDLERIKNNELELPSVIESEFQLFLFQIENVVNTATIKLKRPIYIDPQNPSIVAFSKDLNEILTPVNCFKCILYTKPITENDKGMYFFEYGGEYYLMGNNKIISPSGSKINVDLSKAKFYEIIEYKFEK